MIQQEWDPANRDLVPLCHAILDDATSTNDLDLQIEMRRRLAVLARAAGDLDESRSHLETILASTDDSYLTASVCREAAGSFPLDDPRRLDYLRRAADGFKDHGDLHAACEVLLDAGEIQGSTGNRLAALEFFQQAQVLARQDGNGLMSARADDRIAAAHWELGRGDLAEHHLRQALRVLNASGDADLIANARYRLGWCLANNDPDDQSDEIFWLLGEAKRHAQEKGDLLRVGACDEKAAWTKEAVGDITEAIVLYRSAVAVFESLGADYDGLVAEVNLAGCLIRNGDVNEGLKRYRQVLDRADALGIQALIASTSTRLADQLAKLGDGAEALRYVEQAAAHFADNDDTVEATRHLLATAAAHRTLGNVQAVRELAEAALDRLDRARLPSSHARALEYLAECRLHDGDRTGAESLFGQAVALYLLDDDLDNAHRVAQQILPERPHRNSGGDRTSQVLHTGQYL